MEEGYRFNKGIMQHKVINNLRCVSGDKSLFGQWHQRFVTALGQCDQVHEEIVQHLDVGKDLDRGVEELKTMHGGDFTCVSGDIWNVLLDRADNEAYDNINIFHTRDGIIACGGL